MQEVVIGVNNLAQLWNFCCCYGRVSQSYPQSLLASIPYSFDFVASQSRTFPCPVGESGIPTMFFAFPVDEE
jgi:hypothetical protein